MDSPRWEWSSVQPTMSTAACSPEETATVGVIARLAAGPCFISLLISRAFVSHGLHCKKGTSSRREISRGPWWTQSKTWLWVVGLIVVGRTRVTWIAGLTSCRPGMILLAATVVATAAHATLPTLSALGLG